MFSKKFKKISGIVLSLVLTLSLTACGSTSNDIGQDTSKKIVNVGVTYAPGNINPLSPNGEVATYATGLLFLPLVELDSNMEFQPMLAESIETEDNLTFTIKIDERATWTDGTPITSDDVIFTIKQIANPKVGSIYAYVYSVFEGFDESGYIEEGVTDIPGVIRVDDKTLQLVAKEPLSLTTFQNSVGRYLWTIPEHALKDIAPEDLVASEFFQNPTVTSGPFTLISYDRDHYVQFAANKDYFKGAPKIDQMNFNVMQGTQIYARLQSGEIDMTIPTLSMVPVTDYDAILSLENVTATVDKPITNQYVYINENVIPDAKVRKAFVYAINRQRIVDELLLGNGEVIDGFFTSYSPYFDNSLSVTEYNPEKAKELLAEAGWDSNKEITISVSSGDETFIQAANIVAANLNEVGVKAKIKVTDFATLLDELYSMNYDLGVIQYTFVPVDPYPDISYLLQEGNVNGYYNEEVNNLLAQVKSEDDFDTINEIYARINQIAAEEVPMFSVYAPSSIGVVSKRLSGVEAKAYGTFINVHEWDIVQ